MPIMCRLILWQGCDNILLQLMPSWYQSLSGQVSFFELLCRRQVDHNNPVPMPIMCRLILWQWCGSLLLQLMSSYYQSLSGHVSFFKLMCRSIIDHYYTF